MSPTDNAAHYHEYSLRLLLHKYFNTLETFDGNNNGSNILIDNTEFTKVAQSYQHIVSHYLCSKMKLWMVLFMNTTHGVTDGFFSNQIATGRGNISFHSILYPVSELLPYNEIIMARGDVWD